MTQFYIGVKRVLAWPEEKDGQPGYAVQYSPAYTSWSPKAVFERAYLPMGEVNAGDRVTPEMVEAFISNEEHSIGPEKVTMEIATLRNGFVLTESPGRLAPDPNDPQMGATICRQRFEAEVWKLLAFVLQWAECGLGRLPESTPEAE